MPCVGAKHPRVAREALGQRESQVLEEGGHGHAGTTQNTCRGQEGQENHRRGLAHLLKHRPQIVSPAQKQGTIIVPILELRLNKI